MLTNHGHTIRTLLAAVLIAAVGVWPAYALGGSGALIGWLVGVAASLVGALAGRIPHLFLTQGPDAIVNAAMAGIGVRLLLTAVFALAILLATPWPVGATAAGLVVTYLVLLVIEIRDLVRLADEPPTPARKTPAGSDGAPTR